MSARRLEDSVRRERNGRIDQFRAIAALIVICSHSLGFQRLGWPPWGWLAVSFFFVISGYLITSMLVGDFESMPARKERTVLQRFYWRRLLRIAPPLFMVLLFLQLAYPETLVPNRWYYWFFMANVASNEMGFSPSGSGHLWSIAVEEQFYLLWPVLVMLSMGWKQLRGLIAVIFITGMVVRWATALEWIHLSRFFEVLTVYSTPALMVGAALHFFKDRSWSRINAAMLRIAVLVFSISLWAFSVGLASGFGIWYEIRYDAFLAIAGLSVLHAIQKHKREEQAGGIWVNWLSQLGRISYGLYLFHYPILHVLEREFGLSGIWAALWLFPLTIVLASLSYRYVERPILKWRDAGMRSL